jgi:two-component system response regulator MtrA
LEFGGVSIDLVAHEVRRGEKVIALTRLEFDLLLALAREPGRVFTREALLAEVWGYRHSSDTRLVNVHIQRIRSKIERDPNQPELVLTVRGVGYRAGNFTEQK